MMISNLVHRAARMVLFTALPLSAVTLVLAQGTKPPGATTHNNHTRKDAWRFTGSGGGGAMFYPVFSPHDPKTALVGCDMTGSYITHDGGSSWRMFNLRDRVRFFVFDPVDPNTIYANSLGLFKSTDKGTTWRLLYPDTAEVTGIVSKGDHGEYILVTRDSTLREVLALAIDPANPQLLYAAIDINGSTSLYLSADGGSRWSKEQPLEEGVKKIFIDPSSPAKQRTVYVAGNKGILVRENGKWKSWKGPEGVAMLTECSGGYDAGLKKFVIYGISGRSYFNPEGDRSGIYFTDDGGQHWENRQAGLLLHHVDSKELPEWRTIATSGLHPATVYVSYNGIRIKNDTSCMGIAKSDDYGRTWQLPWKDKRSKGKDIVTPNMANDWLTERFGPSFGENPFSIGVSPKDPGLVYATDFGRTIKTENGGRTWEQKYTRHKENAGWISRGLDVTTGYCVVYDPFDSNHVFLAKTDIGLLESKDAAESWNSATKNNGVPPSWVNTTYWLVFDPEVKGKAWAVMSGTHDLPRPKMFRKKGTASYKGGILVTVNSGKSWQPVSSGLGETAMTHILLDPTSDKNARTLYACSFGKGVFKSTDGGKTWLPKNRGIEGTEPFAWQITRREGDGALFLIISRRSEGPALGTAGDGALYRSTDGAETWTRMTLPEGTNGPTGLTIDPTHPGHFILSAWGRNMPGSFTPDEGGGIFLSNDGGLSWKRAPVKDQHVSSITFDPRNNRYYACGFEGSAYYSEDRGSTWERISGFNFKWTNKVALDERDPEKIFIVTFGGGVWHGPAKGDKTAVEDIITPFK